jgi:hypothetical protein
VGTRGGAFGCAVERLVEEDILKDAEPIMNHVREKEGNMPYDI